MPRPATPLGSYGKITVKQARPGHWVAHTRFRDWDGVSRLVEASGATKASAENNLKTKLVGRKAPTGERIGADSKMSVLWTEYRAQLVEQQAATTTLDTYDPAASRILAAMGDVLLKEVKVQLLHNFLRSLKPGVAHHCRSILTGMLQLAVQYGALDTNPMRDVPRQRAVKVDNKGARPKSPKAMDPDAVQQLLEELEHSEIPCPAVSRGVPIERAADVAGNYPAPTISQYAQEADLKDVVTAFVGTGLRIGELLGLLWSDVDFEARTLTVTGKVVRVRGVGLVRQDYAKTQSSERTMQLPDFVMEMLRMRWQKRNQGKRASFRHPRKLSIAENALDVVFPAVNGELRDPGNTRKQWRRVRAALDLHWVVPHTFRKTVATILLDGGDSVPDRAASDQLGHRRVTTTLDSYYSRGSVHPGAAAHLDKTLGKRRLKLAEGA